MTIQGDRYAMGDIRDDAGELLSFMGGSDADLTWYSEHPQLKAWCFVYDRDARRLALGSKAYMHFHRKSAAVLETN